MTFMKQNNHHANPTTFNKQISSQQITRQLKKYQPINHYLLVILALIVPILPAMANNIEPINSDTTLDYTINGIPIINIARVNGGIFHNIYHQFNIGPQGAIINNSTEIQPEFANNPHLVVPAYGIINEVVSPNPSVLEGTLVVIGQPAHVIFANPYGITCVGCGFINTAYTTLTTGQPQFDSDGQLTALDVQQGHISVSGDVFVTNSAGQEFSPFSVIISRTIEVNDYIHAEELKMFAGANRVYANGQIETLSNDGISGSMPPNRHIAIDALKIGGIYANSILIIATDHGVGINLGELEAGRGDITIHTNGDINLGNTRTNKNIEVTGDHLTLLSGSVHAGQDIRLNNRGDITQDTTNRLNAEQQITIKGQKLKFDGLIFADSMVIEGETLHSNELTYLHGKQNITFNINGGSLWAGEIFSEGIWFDTPILNNQGTLIADRIYALVKKLHNTGEIIAKQMFILDSADILTQSDKGRISSKNIDIQATEINTSGLLKSQEFSLSGHNWRNNANVKVIYNSHIDLDKIFDNNRRIAADNISITVRHTKFQMPSTCLALPNNTHSRGSLYNTEHGEIIGRMSTRLDVEEIVNQGKITSGNTELR